MLILLALLLPPIGFVGFLTYNQASFILPAKVNEIEAPPADLNPEYISLTTPDNITLHGVMLPAKVASPTLVLAFPGNTHNPVGFASYLKQSVFPEDNVAVASFSYRGYPNGITPPSSGKPSQKAMYADALTIYDTLTERLKPSDVKVVGYSIGTAVSTHLALNRKVSAMALVAPIASVRRIAQQRYPWLPVGLLLRHPFATEDVIANLTVPTTLIYSPTDGLVPVEHIESILVKANPSLTLKSVPGTNHVTLALDPTVPGLIRDALTEQNTALSQTRP